MANMNWWHFSWRHWLLPSFRALLLPPLRALWQPSIIWEAAAELFKLVSFCWPGRVIFTRHWKKCGWCAVATLKCDLSIPASFWQWCYDTYNPLVVHTQTTISSKTCVCAYLLRLPLNSSLFYRICKVKERKLIYKKLVGVPLDPLPPACVATSRLLAQSSYLPCLFPWDMGESENL